MLGYLSAAANGASLIAGLVRAGAGKVLGFFSSGWSSYFGMFLFVVVDHWTAIRQLNFVRAFTDIGIKLAKADQTIAEALPVLVGASTKIPYHTALWSALVALFSVFWFLRTINFLIKLVEENVSTAFRMTVASLIWIMSVIAVTGSPPFATLELMYNLREVLDPGRIPFIGGEVTDISGNYSSYVNRTS
jgi:hypothetical protein